MLWLQYRWEITGVLNEIKLKSFINFCRSAEFKSQTHSLITNKCYLQLPEHNNCHTTLAWPGHLFGLFPFTVEYAVCWIHLCVFDNCSKLCNHNKPICDFSRLSACWCDQSLHSSNEWKTNIIEARSTSSLFMSIKPFVEAIYEFM